MSEKFKVFQIFTFMFSHDINPEHIISNLIIFFIQGTTMPQNFEFNETAHALDLENFEIWKEWKNNIIELDLNNRIEIEESKKS